VERLVDVLIVGREPELPNRLGLIRLELLGLFDGGREAVGREGAVALRLDLLVAER
jgi:hypothetical protein